MKRILFLAIAFYYFHGVSVFAFQHHVAIIAHRGASAKAPENTLLAFKQAIEDGAEYLEIDVQQTSDSELVIIHDDTIDRTTNSKGGVRDFTYEQLKQFDAGLWFVEGKFPDEHIPRLQDVIDILDSTTKLLLEIKDGSDVYPNIEQRVIDCITRNHLEDRVIIKSFEDDVLAAVRRINPKLPLLKVYVYQIPIVHITIERGIQFGSVLNKDAEYLQPHWFGLSKGFVNAAHDKGYRIFVWNVNTESRMRAMIRLGVDGIETDDPAALKAVLESFDDN